MDAKNNIVQWLTEADLRFLAETYAKEKADVDDWVDWLRQQPERVETLLDDEALYRRISDEHEPLVHISPYLLFTILMRQAQRDLAQTSFYMDWDGKDRVPVFDVTQARWVFDDEELRSYLVRLLASYTKLQGSVVWMKNGQQVRRVRLSDLDLNDWLAFAASLDEEDRYPIFKRMGDLALFLSGVFADAVGYRYRQQSNVRPQIGKLLEGKVHLVPTSQPVQAPQDIRALEEEGATYYRLAAAHPQAKQRGEQVLLERLADSFHPTRRALNFVSQRYLINRRNRLFERPA
ncbi:MAG: hypothetical protein IMW91_00320 [Firmicutes bacterium]|nr:hypothetical protein [Bacillota bacterium]